MATKRADAATKFIELANKEDLSGYGIDRANFLALCKQKTTKSATESSDKKHVDKKHVSCELFCAELSNIKILGQMSAAAQPKRTSLDGELKTKMVILLKDKANQEEMIDRCHDLQTDLKDLSGVLKGCEKERGEAKQNLEDLVLQSYDLQDQLTNAVLDRDDLQEDKAMADSALKLGQEVKAKVEAARANHKQEQKKLGKALIGAKNMVTEITSKMVEACEAVSAIANVKETLAIEMRSMVEFHNHAVRDPLQSIIGREGKNLDLFKKPSDMEDYGIILENAAQLRRMCASKHDALTTFEMKPGAEDGKEWGSNNEGIEATGLPDICRGWVETQTPEGVANDIVNQIENAQRNDEGSPVKVITSLKTQLQTFSMDVVEKDAAARAGSEAELAEPPELQRFLLKYKDSAFYQKYLQFWEAPKYFVKLQEQLQAAGNMLAKSNEKYSEKIAALTSAAIAAKVAMTQLTDELAAATSDVNIKEKDLAAVEQALLEARTEESNLEKELADLENQMRMLEEDIKRLEESLMSKHAEALKTQSLLELTGAL